MTKVILMHAKLCHVCPAARKFWSQLHSELGFDYEEVDIDTEIGEKMTDDLSIMSVPTAIIDGEVAFVGIPKREEAISRL